MIYQRNSNMPESEPDKVNDSTIMLAPFTTTISIQLTAVVFLNGDDDVEGNAGL